MSFQFIKMSGLTPLIILLLYIFLPWYQDYVPKISGLPTGQNVTTARNKYTYLIRYRGIYIALQKLNYLFKSMKILRMNHTLRCNTFIKIHIVHEITWISPGFLLNIDIWYVFCSLFFLYIFTLIVNVIKWDWL